MQILRNVIAWIVVSSANPYRFSLTLKAGALFLGLLGVDYLLLEDAQDGLVETLMLAGQLITTAIGLFGAVRKVYLTLKPILVRLFDYFS